MRPSEWGRSSKAVSLLLCTAAYAAAAAAAWGTAVALGDRHPLVVAAAADIVATLVVFGCSVALDNSSVYDPYWSVAPLAIAVYFAMDSGAALGPFRLAALCAVTIWAVRLTANWVMRWRGLSHEDWRYAGYRGTRTYWLVSLVGFHLVPTVVVFLGCLPLYGMFYSGAPHASALGMAAICLTAGAIWLEAESDRQLRLFLRSAPARGQLLRSGLWRYLRHPNYVGEILFWWGLFLLALATGVHLWWTVAGALAVTLLFVFVSIPMMNRHMADRYSAFSASAGARERPKAPAG